MSSDTLKAEKEQRVSAALLVAFAALLLAMMVVELIMVGSSSGAQTSYNDFVQNASLSYVMSLFLAYLVIGILGFVGTLGLVRTYGGGTGLLGDVARYSCALYFFSSYWLWSTTWIVQHKITLLTSRPTTPPEWLLQIYEASDALWSFGSWAAMGPSFVLFVSVGLLLLRGARQLPRWAGWGFIVLAVSQFLGLAFVGARGFGVANAGHLNFATLNDWVFTLGRVVVFLLAAASLYSERGVFVRTRR